MNDMTRRTFTLAAGGTIALTVLGCGGESSPPGTPGTSNPSADGGETGGKDDEPKERPQVPASSYTIGAPDQYKTKGMYTDHHFDKRVWLYSTGTKLIAMLDLCTHSSCELNWEADNNVLSCPCHRSKFDLQGKPLEGSKARFPLDRLAMKVKDGVIEIDPNVRYVPEEWEEADASISL